VNTESRNKGCAGFGFGVEFLPVNTTATEEQIASYQQDGFLHVPAFLAADEVAELKQGVLDALDEMGSRKINDEDLGWEDKKQSYYDKVFTQRLNLHRINDTVKKYMLDAELGRMVCDLEGVDGFRVWHDQTLIKEPYGNPTAWHLDDPYWSFTSKHAISIWIALEDATLENGCMWFVPGSHKIARFENVGIDENMASLFDVYPDMKNVDPVSVPMKAGDCSFHNGLTAHGAGANMTRGRRIAMTCGYMPAGSTFNGQANILPPDYLASLSVGDVLDNEAQNPLIFSRTADAPAT